ncbi:hypothetical protein RE6C_01393 [Rhodopirellula europaea 6C]|uniref:Uncharacterized protein n=2 Tax=Rhodopirellula TaxID=265488 RepID=M2B835_9BACT|nr:hypothetical protein RE6C_01393 [Rhodopirellula europaea 6C]
MLHECQTLRGCFLLLLVSCTIAIGCQPTTESRLGLVYTPPGVPDDVPSHFKPEPDTKLESWLDDGETHLDLKAHYLDAHRCGWDAAIWDWDRYGEFKMNTERDAYSYRADVPSGTSALWIGYSDARRQIEAMTQSAPHADGG